MAESLYVIDVYSLIFQLFHAIPERTNPRGQPTNAAFGITRDLLNLYKQKKPAYWIAAIDSEGEGTRNDLYADYKANRAEAPADLVPQFEMIFELIDAFGIPSLSVPGWEADDVIATAVRLARADDMDVVVVTSDKDIRQLLGPGVRIFNLRKKQFFGPDELQAEWGIRPEQCVDFQALVGDSVDNVPGVPGVGPKTAATLLAEYKTLDGVLAHAAEVKQPKLRENLIKYAEQALLSRDLVRLNNDLDLQIDWEEARAGQFDFDRLYELTSELDFPGLRQEIEELRPAEQLGPQLTRAQITVDTREKFAAFLEELRQQPRVCVDLETTSLDAVRAEIVGWAFSWQEGRGHYLPVQGPAGQARLDADEAARALKPLLEDPAREIVNQNIKYDLLVLRRLGIRPASIGVDPMVGHYLLHAGARSHSLDDLSKRYFRHRMIPIKSLIGGGKVQKQMFEVDVPEVAEYAVEDAEVAWRLVQRISAELRQAGLWELYWDLERPLIRVLEEMEWNGIRIDAALLRAESEAAAARLAEMAAEIHTLAGREFNVDSPVQLREVLFEELKLPVIKRTKTGPSTDQDVLEELADRHPIAAKLSAHRQLAKLKSTYLDALPTMINPATGRIHASFNQVVAATGRLSSSDPNLQNIPTRTDEGRRIRAAFLPGEGQVLLCADYSQIELRMLAHFSGDEALCAAFQSGQDVHTSVAAQIFKCAEDAVTREQRRVAKAVNFGVIYGQTPFGLGKALGIPKEEAARFIDAYFARHAGVAAFMNRVLDECREMHQVTTILGRRRAITGVRSAAYRTTLNLPERTAVNTVIQGSAADLIKQAMIRIHARLQELGHPARMLLQIHDELVFETPPDRLAELAGIVREEMQQAIALRVPLVVDVSSGPNWRDTERIGTGF